MDQVFCRALWRGDDYITDGVSILWILGWSDRTAGSEGDVHYRLWNFGTNDRADADQKSLLERGYHVAQSGSPDHDRARRAHEAFGRALHASICAAAGSAHARDGRPAT